MPLRFMFDWIHIIWFILNNVGFWSFEVSGLLVMVEKYDTLCL